MAVWDDPNILSGTSVQPTTGQPTAKADLGFYCIHQGSVSMEWALRFKMLEMPNHVYMFNSNQPYDTAREMCVRSLLDKDVKWIFSLDSDVIAPINAVTALMQFAQKFDFPVISGLYWAKKKEPVPMPAAWLLTGEKPEENRFEFMPVDVKPHIEKRSIIPVDVVGAGCLLVKAEIFKKLDESNPDLPFFCWGLGRQKLQLAGGKPPPKTSEDFYFCLRLLKELNIHPQLATPVQCDHICNTTVKRGLDGQFELGRM